MILVITLLFLHDTYAEVCLAIDPLIMRVILYMLNYERVQVDPNFFFRTTHDL